jgi:hypothetical protein
MAVRRPVLLLAAPARPGPRAKLTGRGSAPHVPKPSRQAQRLGPKFNALVEALEARRLAVGADASALLVEQVVVLETVAPVDELVNVLNRVPGLEWLGEIDEPDIPPDPDFFDLKDKTKPLHGRLYLSFASQQALTQLLGLWQRWLSGERLHHGLGTFKQLFQLLKDVRRWGVKDRLETTGVLDDWRERVADGQETVRCEIELWFRRDPRVRAAAANRLRNLLKELGGRHLQQVTLEEIAYDAILAELPISEIKHLLKVPDTALVQCEDVRLFGIVGQMAAPAADGQPELDSSPPDSRTESMGEPVAALLDGLPLQNHQRLLGRLDIDDPDQWETDYPAKVREHGTAMASLILHGDVGMTGAPLPRRLYVRPIMRPRSVGTGRDLEEAVPESGLIVDLVHRAVRRIAEGDGDAEPAAPNVCIINFSIGDRARTFDGGLSPLGRLLDYLAYRYKILFLVSAGNWNGAITIDRSGPLAALAPADLQNATLQALAAENRSRRLLSPAEGVNVLTVGAAHSDASGPINVSGWVDPYSMPGMPSPINAQGMGYRRCIKPDVLMAGGRILVRETIPSRNEGSLPLEVFKYTARPGAKVAAPGSLPGDTGAMRYIRGTSVATALTTRAAVQLHEIVDELRNEPDGHTIAIVPMATWVRTMLVHAATWSAADVIEATLRTDKNARGYREYVTRLVGYGEIDRDRLGVCTDHRVTALGGGALGADQANVHRFPLPPSLAGKAGWRRLTLTLAYFTPINPMHQGWRRAHLWFEPPQGQLSIARTQADWKATLRGTVQHEILEGSKADAFLDGSALEIKVSCRETAGSLEETVPYALAVSLEVAEEIGVPIYDEIQQRIRPSVRIQSRR